MVPVTSGRLGILDASEIPPTFGVSGDWIIGLILIIPPTALPRGFRLHLPLGEVGIAFSLSIAI